MTPVVLIIIAGLVAYGARGFRTLHMLQLDGYRVERYLRHSLEKRTPGQFAIPSVIIVTAVAGAALLRVAPTWSAPVVTAFALAEAGLFAYGTARMPLKKPPVYTARLLRIAGAMDLVVAATALAGWVAVLRLGVDRAMGVYVLAGVIVWAAPVLASVGVLLLEPLEARIRRGFVRQAEERLREVAPLVIGVAGSYGKTTTKHALAAVLSARHRVFATPESYNTLLGVTRAINEQLDGDTEVFVVEMGARQPGDIDEICGLVRPRIGVVTRLGNQHLEYFKTSESVVRTKTELLRALPNDGTAVVDADGLTDFAPPLEWSARTLRVTADAGREAECRVSDVELSGQGTAFTVTLADGSAIEARTPLLGRHAAANCALAVVVAHELGLTDDEIRRGLATMEPVPHRLQVVRSDTVTVIDDAFNSNPEGFAAALEVLAAFSGRRILVTPGMVELGSETVPAHVRIAELAADSCDVVILVGRNAPPEFARTLQAKGFGADRLVPVESLAKATELIGTMVRAGDVVLFENDLPDNFG